jgi:biopolymer transport protein ExbD
MTVVGWMVYAMAVGLLLAPAAWLLERGLGRVGAPTRWVWAGSLILCVVLPAVSPLGGPSGRDEVVTISVAVDGLIAAAPSGPTPAAAPPRGIDVLTAAVGWWRAEIDRLLATAATEVVDGRPIVGWWLAIWWASASLILAALLLSGMIGLSRRASGWPRQAHLGREVRLAPRLGPATLGLLHPEIVLPRWAAALPTPRLELILAHEEEHVRARDPLLLAFGLACIVACPWNPFLWWQHRRLKDAVEVDCDRRVLRRGAAAPSYGDLLLWMGSRRHLAWLPATTMTGSRSLLERRLTAMKKTTLRAALPGTIGASILASGLVVVACTTEPPVAGDGAEPSGAILQRNPRVVDVWVQPDGRIRVNDVPHTMEDVSKAIRQLDAAADGEAVVSLQADPDVPYGVMDGLQKAIRAGGVPRVIFALRTEPRRTPPGEFAEVLEGLALVLPEAGEERQVSGRNVLHLIVQPSGVVEFRRGASTSVQRVPGGDVAALWRQEVANNPLLIAALKTHPDASYTHMVELLDALHEAEAQRISLQVLVEPQEAS